MLHIFSSIALSWKIGVFSYRFVFENPKLLFFPFLSFANIVAAEWFLFKVFTPQSLAMTLFIGYFLAVFIAIFFNVATIQVVDAYLKGQKPSIALGIKRSFTLLPHIVVWTLFSGTIGLLLRAIGAIAAKLEFDFSWLIDAAWGVTTYFVVPVLCFQERLNPFSFISESARVVKSAWDRGQFRMMGSYLVSTLLCITVYVTYTILVNVFGTRDPIIVDSYNIPSWLNWLILAMILWVALLSSITNAVLKTIYYRYLTDNHIPSQIDKSLLDDVVHSKVRT